MLQKDLKVRTLIGQPESIPNLPLLLNHLHHDRLINRKRAMVVLV